MFSEITSDYNVVKNLQKVTYGKNNELGPKTLEAFMNFMDKKYENPLIQLALVGCKSRLSSISPLLKMIDPVESQLQTLLVPRINLGDEGISVIFELIKKNAQLRNSWFACEKNTAKRTLTLLKLKMDVYTKKLDDLLYELEKKEENHRRIMEKAKTNPREYKLDKKLYKKVLKDIKTTNNY